MRMALISTSLVEAPMRALALMRDSGTGAGSDRPLGAAAATVGLSSKPRRVVLAGSFATRGDVTTESVKPELAVRPFVRARPAARPSLVITPSRTTSCLRL